MHLKGMPLFQKFVPIGITLTPLLACMGSMQVIFQRRCLKKERYEVADSQCSQLLAFTFIMFHKFGPMIELTRLY